MGDWYVIASIPTRLEKGGPQRRRVVLPPAGRRVETTFTFRKGSVDGKLKRYHPKGFVRDKRTNAAWEMQFVWPFMLNT